METISVDKDIRVFCITARSFPDGVMEAYDKLYAMVPPASGRRYFGISRPDKGVIVYKAAAEEMKSGEAEQFNCEPFTIKTGNYISITVKDFMQDVSIVGRAFQKLLSQPGLDPQGYCLEWYLNDTDVRCMIKLKS